MDAQTIIKQYVEAEHTAIYDTLYYYAPISTFLNGILKNEELVLWAGHIDYMEDRMEFEKGMSIIRSITEMDEAYSLNIEKGIKNRFPFQISLSRARDCYPMWKIYGHGELAVMLILDGQLIQSSYKHVSPCIYEDSEEYNVICNYLLGRSWLDAEKGETTIEQISDFLFQFPYLAKDKHYSYEQEVRIFRKIRRNDDKLKYKVSGNLVKPFKELHFAKEILKGIMIGPCSDEEFELNKKAITLKLLENGFTHLHYSNPFQEDDVTRSDILIRK